MVRSGYYGTLLAGFFLLQTAFWQLSLHRLPELGVVPNVPGKATLDALAFGDPEFLFRTMGFLLGTAGDTFGRSTALKDYDLNKVYRWFTLLDTLNNQSNLLPAMAAYYFAQTQKTQDARHMVDYLYDYAYWRPKEKWWWLTQGVYIALHRLHDRDLALKLAQPLADAEDAPLWVRQMLAFVHEQRGEFEDAATIMKYLQENIKDIPPGEQQFMDFFVNERLGKLEDAIKKEEEKGAPPQ